MSPAREAVAAEAMSWLATPYAHRQRLKGVGVDCAQLPLAVYAACGLIPPAQGWAYPRQWHLHRGEERYVEGVLRFGREIAPESAATGDLLLWRYGRTFSHGALLVAAGRVVHAVAGLGVVLDDVEANAELKARPMRAFSLFPVS